MTEYERIFKEAKLKIVNPDDYPKTLHKKYLPVRVWVLCPEDENISDAALKQLNAIKQSQQAFAGLVLKKKW